MSIPTKTMQAAATAFAAGAQGGTPAAPEPVGSQVQLHRQVARAGHERDVAVQRAEDAEDETAVLRTRDALHLTDDQAEQVVAGLRRDREAARAAGDDTFDRYESIREQVAALRDGIAPAPSGRRPRPLQTVGDVQRQREKYRQRLRELGLLDPATHSIPGGGTFSR